MRVETHLHCTPASACAVDLPHAMLAEVARQGIDAVFLTDHNSLATWDNLMLSDIPEGLLVCPGVECSVGSGPGEGGDVLVLADVPDVLRSLDTGGRQLVSAQDLADRLSPFPRSRWFASWAHPLGHLAVGGLDAHARFLLGWLDAVEGFNGNLRGMEARSPAIFAEADRLGLRRTAGSDAHAIREVGQAVTVVPGNARTAAELVALLHAAPAFGHDIRRRPAIDDFTDLDIRFE